MTDMILSTPIEAKTKIHGPIPTFHFSSRVWAVCWNGDVGVLNKLMDMGLAVVFSCIGPDEHKKRLTVKTKNMETGPPLIVPMGHWVVYYQDIGDVEVMPDDKFQKRTGPPWKLEIGVKDKLP